MNPLLSAGPTPLFDQILPEHVAPAIEELLGQAQVALEAVTAEGFPAQWSAIATTLDMANEKLSMAWGALAGLKQTNIRRLMAYSTIAQMGFVVLALSVATPQGMGSALVYTVVYAVTSLGMFGLLMRVPGQDLSLTDVTGLVKSSPATAYLLAVFLLSLAGMPFFAGFFTKLSVFQSALNQQHYAVVVIAALSSVIAMYYYLRVIKVMIFDDPAFDQQTLLPHSASLPMAVLAALFLAVFFIFPGPEVMAFAEKMAGSLLSPVSLPVSLPFVGG
jgi:NADH-quinone oxidoreductase subunit N